METPATESRPVPEIPGYEILEEIGRGGMSIVWKARHRLLGRLVAVKMILAGQFSSAKERDRFRAEAEAIAGLQHAHVVQLHEFGESTGQPFLVLEYIAGGTLQQRLAGRPQQPHDAAALVELLARAVGEAHGKNLIHRDIKPANVLLATDGPLPYGTPKLTDFGLAKRLEGSGTAPTQALAGTPTYMAPEQVPEGPDVAMTRPVRPPVDIYALGVMLYEMLTGRPPFLGTDWMTTLMQVSRRDPLAPRILQPGTPRDLETICLKCLRKDPAARYARAEDLADDLRRFLDGKPIKARPVSAVEKIGKWTRRHPLSAVAGATTVLALVLGLLGLFDALRSAEARQQAEEKSRKIAEKAGQTEARLRTAAERSLYFSRITQADLFLRENEVVRARAILKQCSTWHRDWEWHYLWRLCNHGLLIHSVGQPVHVVAASSVGVAALTFPGDAKTGLLLWDPQGNEKGRWPVPHAGVGKSLLLDAAGRTLVAVLARPQDKTEHPFTILVWDIDKPGSRRGAVSTFRPSWGLPKPAGGSQPWTRSILPSSWCGISTAARKAGVLPRRNRASQPWRFSKTADRLAAACADGRWLVWDMAKKAKVHDYQATPTSVLTFNADGQYLVAHAPNGFLQIRQSGTAKQIAAIIAEPGELQYSPFDRYLLMFRPDAVRSWDLTNGQRSSLGTHVSDPKQRLSSMAIGPDGRTVATGAEDGSIRIWDLPTGQEWNNQVYRGHTRQGAFYCFFTDRPTARFRRRRRFGPGLGPDALPRFFAGCRTRPGRRGSTWELVFLGRR